MNTKQRPNANCHPDRPHLAKGLCKSCYDAAYQRDNREVVNERKRQWRKDNPDKALAISRKYLYGVSPEEVERLYKKQKGLCAVCRIGEAKHLDHNHLTKQVRGLLCGKCNQAIGLFGESIESMRKAIRYLQKYVNLAK